MLITVFGATGQVGKCIVQMALAAGDKVRAFGRNVEALIDEDLRKEDFTAIQGYVFNQKDVFKAIDGSDAVLSALGGSVDGTDKTRSLGMQNIVEQMEKAKVKRIIVVGGSAVLKDDEYEYRLNNPEYPEQYKAVGIEHLKAYECLKKSNLDWTYICSPDIIGKEATGKYNTNEDYAPPASLFTITAGNIAQFMLDELSANKYIKKE